MILWELRKLLILRVDFERLFFSIQIFISGFLFCFLWEISICFYIEKMKSFF